MWLVGDFVTLYLRRESIATAWLVESELIEAVGGHLQAMIVALWMAETIQSVLPFTLACYNTVAFIMVGEKAQTAWRTWNISIIWLMLYQAFLGA